jgi:hypothetical protein
MAEARGRGCLAFRRPEEVRRSRRVAQEEARLHRLNVDFFVIRYTPFCHE